MIKRGMEGRGEINERLVLASHEGEGEVAEGLLALGWQPKVDLAEGIRRSVRILTERS
jgi:nucleoside-diphosphate-sugar epimerase